MITRYWRGDLAGVEKHFTAGLKFFDDPGFRQLPGAAVSSLWFREPATRGCLAEPTLPASEWPDDGSREREQPVRGRHSRGIMPRNSAFA